jgi:uncharacterized protein (TIGR00156 family)
MKQITMIKKMKTLMLVILLTIIFGSVNAQYTGPGSQAKKHHVKEVLDNAQKLDRKDTMVELVGFLVEQIKDEDFWFQDATGKIRVEIDKKHLPDVPFNEKTEVIIMGEVDYNLLEGTEIEVEKKVELVNSSTPENSENKNTTH